MLWMFSLSGTAKSEMSEKKLATTLTTHQKSENLNILLDFYISGLCCGCFRSLERPSQKSEMKLVTTIATELKSPEITNIPLFSITHSQGSEQLGVPLLTGPWGPQRLESLQKQEKLANSRFLARSWLKEKKKLTPRVRAAPSHGLRLP
jgi:hypothetical protein